MKLDEFKASTNTTDWNTFKSTVVEFEICHFLGEQRTTRWHLFVEWCSVSVYDLKGRGPKQAWITCAMAKMETLSTTNQLLFHGAPQND